MKPLKIAIPSKGRLQNDTFRWFQSRGLTIKRTGREREYSAEVTNMRGVELVLLSASEVPEYLAEGTVHLGITGLDLIEERLSHCKDNVETVRKMGFGQADLVIAVPKFWIDVFTIDDLDEVAGQYRARHGHRLRIATKYHNIVRSYLTREGVADYQIVDSQGATEGTIKNLTAEVIADITSSGSTLDANHLRPLDGLPILASEACVFASRMADWINIPALSKVRKMLGWR